MWCGRLTLSKCYRDCTRYQSSYQVSGVVVGEGFRFGYKAKGDTETLQQLGRDHGIAVSVVSLVSSGCTEGPETVRPTLLFVDCVNALKDVPPSQPNICLMTADSIHSSESCIRPRWGCEAATACQHAEALQPAAGIHFCCARLRDRP